ncbi:hypothetical protein JL720_1934 [Aureococcus anophagefferens]|nr:hypothetical protein JL720_1934 [Aureococcus anophagefferens]
MMAGRADELGETGAYDEAKYETHAGEFFDGPMDGALESKYGDLFAGYDEDGEALGSPAEETVASGGTQKTLATLATARFRAMSDKELVKMVRELDGSTGARAATRKAADEAALVADQELTRAVQQDRLAGEAARAELAALADAKRAALGADAAAQRQRATAARERDAERVAEHVAQRTERSCAALAEKALKAKAAKAEKLEAAALKARETVDLEIAGAERRVRAQGRLDAARKRRAEKQALDDRKARAAVEGRTKAKRRVARSGAVTREVRAHCEDARREREDRAEAVLQLKADTDAATVELRGRNEKAAMRKQAKRDEFAREKARLEARGENPYEAKRRAVIERIAVDDARQRKIEAHEAHAAALEKAHRDALGRNFTEARTMEYLLSRTGKSLVDPTGRSTVPMFPSQETKILDHTFGTGKNSRKTEAQRRELIRDLAKLPANETVAEDLGEFGRLIPKLRSVDDSSVARKKKDDGGDGGGGALKTLQGLLPPDEAPPGEALNASQAKLAGEVAQAGAGDEAEAAKAPRKHGSELSKFERDCLARAQRRQKDRLASGAPQIIAGRTLRSAAFVAEPTRIEFKDFAVGESHHRKITLTNVSLSFNNFKVLPLGDAIVDFFDVSYVKPGRMSAGTSCVIDVTFTPQVDEDIFDELPLLAATGPFSVPIVCTKKKVVPSISDPHVQFDNVVMGETSTFSLIIKNQGALPTKFEFFDPKTGAPAGIVSRPATPGGKSPRGGAASPAPAAADAAAPEDDASLDDDGDDDDDARERALLDQAASVGAAALKYADGLGPIQYANGGEVAGYAEVAHVIKFAPLRAGYAREQVAIRFEGFAETIPLSIIGSSIEVPIYVAEPVVDMRCAVYGKLYRKKLMLRNRGKIAFKAIARAPKEFREFFEYQPDMGFVQPGADFEMSIKFRPTPAVVDRCAPYCIKDRGIIAVPMRIMVPDQALPVYYTLRAQLTRSDVSFSTTALDYGPCYVTEALSAPVVLTNESALPQKFGFVNLSAEVDVQPNDGFGVLLPRESRTVDVIFKPVSAVNVDLNLTMRTTMNNTYAIKVRGRGLEPALKFSFTVLKFPPASPGDRVVASVLVSHPSAPGAKREAAPRTFELVVPKPLLSFLTVQPAVATVAPGETRRVEISFAPPRSKGPRDTPSLRDANVQPKARDLDAVFGHAPPPPPDDAEPEPEPDDDAREAAAAAKRARDAELKAARDAAYAAATTPPEPFEGTLTSSAAEPPPPLEVQTTTVERTFWCDCEKIDFGQLAVGQTSTLPLRLRNLAADGPPLEVKAVPGLNGVGPFMMVNALRPLHPKAPPHSALLQFAPTARGVRSEHLELVCPALGRTVRVALRGEGVSPTLELDPPDGFVDMGHVFVGCARTKELLLHNTSVFPLSFCLTPLGEPVPRENRDASAPFVCVPSEATVAPGATLAVKIKFRPDHGRVWAYYQKLRVEVPNEDKRHVLTVLGRCHDHQMYVVADDRPLSLGAAFEDPFGLPAELDDAAAEVRDMMGLGPPVNPKIAIRFPRVADRPKADDGGDDGDRAASASVLVGCCAADAPDGGPRAPKKPASLGSNGTFEVELDAATKAAGYFAASPDKGTVPAGGTAPVAFTFTPPEAQAGNGLDVGRWIKTVAKVHLKGFPESFTYDVELEGCMPNLSGDRGQLEFTDSAGYERGRRDDAV